MILTEHIAMFDPTLLKRGDDWVLYRSEVIEHEPEEMKAQLGRAYRHFKNTFTGCDSSLKNDGLTLSALPELFSPSDSYNEDHKQLDEMQGQDLSGYRFYNVFALTSPSPLFWGLLKEVSRIVRLELRAPAEQPLWMQCWMNMHNPKEVLGWHDHHFPFHGYISIDPKNSTTQFKEGDITYEIENEVGNIYFGPGWNRMHRVVVNDDYEGPRITLGFDIITEPTLPDDQFSLIPLL